MARPPITLPVCADGKARSKFTDGLCPIISGVSGSLADGSTLTVSGNFSAKNPSGYFIHRFATPDKVGQSWCDSYPYAVDAGDFFGLGAVGLADTQIGSSWVGSGTPFISHPETDEFFYTMLWKIEHVNYDAQGPDWVSGETVSQGSYRRRPDGGTLSGYQVWEKTSAGSLVSTTPPESDSVNWTTPSAPQIKMARQMVKAGEHEHYGIFSLIFFYESDKALPPAADACVNVSGQVMVEGAPASGYMEISGTALRDQVFGKWCRSFSYYKKDPGNGKGSHFFALKNEESKQCLFNTSYGGGSGSPNAKLNDKSISTTLTPFFEPRFIYDANFTEQFPGVGDQFWMPFYKRGQSKFRMKLQALVANNSMESVWVANNPNIEIAMATGKAHALPQQSRSFTSIPVTFYLGDFVPADSIYLFVYNSNGKFSAPYKIRDGV